MVFQLQLAGFDFREVENIVDDGQERVGAAARGFDIFPLFVGQFRVEQQRNHADDAVHRRADFVAHVGEERGLGDGGLFKFLVERQKLGVVFHELLLALPQGAVGGVALHLVQIRAGMIADAGNQFDAVRNFYEVIIGADAEGLALDLRVFVRGEDNDGDVFGRGIRAVLADQR